MAPRLPRLNLKPLIASVAIAAFSIRELVVLQAVMQVVRPGRRAAMFLFHPNATRKSFWVAVTLGFAVAFLGRLISWLILRPVVRVWLSPRVDHSEGLFRMAASEWVLDSAPARRRKAGWSWEPGSLVHTNQGLWFFPTAWHGEPWNVRLTDADQCRFVPAPAVACGLIVDLPDRLAVQSGEGETSVFALADPDGVAEWLPLHSLSGASRLSPDAA